MITMPSNVTNAIHAGGFSQTNTKIGQTSDYQGKEGRNFYTRMRKPTAEQEESGKEKNTRPDAQGHLDITA